MTITLSQFLVLLLAILSFTFPMTAVMGQQTASSAAPTTTTTTTLSPPSSTTLFQSTNDSIRIQAPNGWIVDDLNNTGFELSEEVRLGYGLLAQLCPEQERGGEGFSPDTSSPANNATNNNRCQGAQEEVIHVVRYPDLGTRIQPANNITAYHLEKLQEIGYNNIQIVNKSDSQRYESTNKPNSNNRTSQVCRNDIQFCF
jgi:hypothetical protein